MVTPREPWNIRPARTRAAVPAALKTEVEAKAKHLIETVLKPRHVLPPPTDGPFNHITDIGAKWYLAFRRFCPRISRRF